MTNKLNIFVVALGALALSSCMTDKNRSTDDLVGEKIQALKTFSFIYDLECVDVAGRERADTTFMTMLPHKETDIIQLLEEVMAPDGMYLIYNNRIINYAKWEI